MKNKVEIRQATMREARVFYGGRPIPYDIDPLYGMFIDDCCVGLCGVVLEPEKLGSFLSTNARHIGFLDIKEVPDGWGPRVFRAIRQVQRDLQVPLYVQRDDDHPQSSRLLKLLGFQRLEETERDRRTDQQLEMWRWQPSQQ